MRFYIPSLETFKAEAGITGSTQVGLYSSIYTPYPIASVRIDTGKLTPDTANVFLGHDLGDISYQLINSVSAKPKTGQDEVEEVELGSFFNLPGFFIKEIENEAQGNAASTTYFLENELSVYQSYGLQGYYNTKNASEIMGSLKMSNSKWDNYGCVFANSDQSTSVFRKMSHTDIDFIEEQIYPNFVIEGGCPWFWVGLDGIIHLDSISHILGATETADALLIIGGHSAETDAMVIDAVRKDSVKEYGPELTTVNYKLNIGGADFLKSVNPKAVCFENGMPYTPTSSILKCSNTAVKSTVLPISTLFQTGVNGKVVKSMENRPGSNVRVEAKNLLFRDVKPLIKLEVKGCAINYGNKATDEETILSAGQTVSVVLPYAYSMYNGIYIIEDIEYKSDKSNEDNITVDMHLAANNMSSKCYDLLSTHKDLDFFNESYAPSINKSLLVKSD